MKRFFLSILVLLVVIATGCTSVNYSTNMTGVSDYSTVVVKDYTTLGIVMVTTTETHHSGPLGFVKGVKGSKITYAMLMSEAGRLNADDIINIRIDVNSNYQATAFDWLIGWTRNYTYTGTALAIKYTERLETQFGDPQLGGIPKAPEKTRAVRTGRDGKTSFR